MRQILKGHLCLCYHHHQQIVKILSHFYVVVDDVNHQVDFLLFLDVVDEDKYGQLGVTDSYFVSFHFKRAHFDKCFHWPGYKGGSIIMGCSRALKKEVLDSVNWRPWPDGKNYSLNNHSHRVLSAGGSKLPPKGIRVKDGGHLHIDIKTNGNISSVAPLWKEKPLLSFDDLMMAHLDEPESLECIYYRAEKVKAYERRKK